MLDRLDSEFDAVVMLTWSNWRTEPRSNRYHYATRLSRRWPVYFSQTTTSAGPVDEAVDGFNIRILHSGEDYGPAHSDRLHAYLQSKGVRRPLYWYYNPHYRDFIERYPARLVVYHATEDYLGEHKEISLADPAVPRDLRALLPRTDLVVAVTAGVEESIRVGGYEGPVLLLRNGCDAEHWISALPARTPATQPQVAFFQGGVNKRLDFRLLGELVDAMPDWQFHFCGNAAYAPQPDWNLVLGKSNTRSFGFLQPDRIAALQARAAVGIIPFLQVSNMQISLPLKAYEYVASGLPVVSVPIAELGREPDLFSFATNAKEFEQQLRALAPTRWDPQWIERRHEAARRASYDRRFDELLVKLSEITRGGQTGVRAAVTSQEPAIAPPEKAAAGDKTRKAEPAARRRKKVLVSYSATSTHVQTTMDYLVSLSRYLNADVQFVHATNSAIMDFDLDAFDAVFQSYCVRYPYEGYVSASYSNAMSRFRGPKILAVQDEYERTDNLKNAIKRVGFDVVLTCVPENQIEHVYPKADFPDTEFVQVLTGYVPDNIANLAAYATPLRERKTLVGYRGRDIGGRYGRLAFDKLEIGRRVKEYCEVRGLPVDIDWTEESRIYGLDWFRFLGSCRATLGTESGANVFDFDGSIEAMFNKMTEERGKRPSYEEFLPLVADRDNAMDMGQLSPKFFEAAVLRTPMILLRGRYSDYLEPDTHYIPLEKDYSNLPEVIERLNNLDELEALADRLHEHLVASGRFTYQSFGALVDKLIDRKIEEKRLNPPAIVPADYPEPELQEFHRKLMLERPSPGPHSHHYFWSKEHQRLATIYEAEYRRISDAYQSQNQAYEAEIQRLNTVYPAEIQRLNTVYQEQNRVYENEIARLNKVYTEEIQRITAYYEDQAKSYSAEIARLNREISRLSEALSQQVASMA